MKKPTPLTEKWKCVFHQSYLRASVDPWISIEWRKVFGDKAPFGDLRTQWRREHCRTLNPYGSEDCPYEGLDCARAFHESVKITLKARPRTPVGYFKKVARMKGAQRADEKPSSRGLTTRSGWRYSPDETNVPAAPEAPSQERSGHPGDEAESVQQGRRVRRPDSGPTGIGELLGSLDLRPHQLDRHEREESAE